GHDRFVTITVAPASCWIEIFKSEPNGVHPLMATRASRIRSVCSQQITNARIGVTRRFLRQLTSIRGRGWRRSSEKFFKHPFAPKDRTCPKRHRWRREHSTHWQNTTAVCILQRNPSHSLAVNYVNTVVSRELFIEEGVVAVYQFQEVLALRQHIVKVLYRFLIHCLSQRRCHFREPFGIQRIHFTNGANAQPLG